MPQGSLLGVLLFQVLIDGLPRVLRYANSVLYADDTTIFLVGKSLHFLKVKLQHDLNLVSDWLKVNSLKLNVNKTKAILFNKKVYLLR